jgi:high-affinity iron transporter
MLVLTGVMLGFVLLVMVGEQAQEMQLAGWIPATKINWLTGKVPDWMGVWFSIYPTIETLLAQFLAAFLVIGSYYMARRGTSGSPRKTAGEFTTRQKSRVVSRDELIAG